MSWFSGGGNERMGMSGSERRNQAPAERRGSDESSAWSLGRFRDWATSKQVSDHQSELKKKNTYQFNIQSQGLVAKKPEGSVDHLAGLNQQLREQLVDVNRSLDEARRGRDDIRRERDKMKQELEAHRTFSSKVDAVSEADIMREVEALNNAIYQTSAAIADTGEIEQWQGVEISPSESTATFFGSPLLRLTQRTRKRPTFLTVSNALQACINHFCAHVLSYSFWSFHKESRLLRKIHEDIRASEPRTVCAHWRVLTYMHNRNVVHDHQSMVDMFLRRLVNVFGWQREAVEAMYGDDFSHIMKLALNVRDMIFRDYVSGEITIISPHPGEAFDSATMELTDPRSGAINEGCIRCTTDLGMKRTLLLQKRSGDQWINEEETVVLLKAKVVMERVQG
ncbi:hypothetical protein AMATHDRAFT_50358 [Amanita thiersii Skay4041]|uniref:Uncharacterized protein n=1 Tax=Amanita thiersii Skay4041 TaxID=703135 RepID=A0A2A9N914_9AGAR|nr:hypothetical protein AMATHDRAFT_50358 [Amanita thiersii Skay4041]